MSTFDELDALAHRATATLLADAPTAAETDAALEAVKAGTPTVVPMTPRVTRNGARAGRTPLLVVGAAAVVLAVGIAGLIAVTRPGSSPAAPGVSPAPSAVPVTPSAPSATVPSTFEPQPGPFTLTMDRGETEPREVLYAARIGTADDELGMQQCDDCESDRPHDPIITADGTIVIFDMANQRWVVVGRDPVPIDPSLDLFELQLGRDGLIYSSAKVGDEDTWSIVVWDPANLDTPVDTIPTTSSGASLALFAYDEGIRYVEGTLDYIGPDVAPLGTLSWTPAGGQQTLVRTYADGATTTWIVPATWTVQLPAALLPDGSAMLGVAAEDELSLVRLFPDGRSLAMPPVQGDGVWAAPSFTLAGVSVVQRTDDGFEIARYPLPQHPPSTEGPVTAPDATSTPSTVQPTATSAAGGPLQGTPFIVTTTDGPRTTPEVLYSASTGPAPDQLGVEACQECDTPRPFDPVVTADGTILIVDWVNDRIVSVSDGAPNNFALPDAFVPLKAVLGYDGRLYIVGEIGPGTPDTNRVVLRYDVDALGTPEIIPHNAFVTVPDALPTGVDVNGDHVPDVAYVDGDNPPPLHPGIEFLPEAEGQPRQVRIDSTSDMQITWTLPEGWTPGGFADALADYPEAVVATSGPDGRSLLAHLLPDGSSVAMPLPSTAGQNVRPFVDERGIVVLEPTSGGFNVVRYPLPG